MIDVALIFIKELLNKNIPKIGSEDAVLLGNIAMLESDPKYTEPLGEKIIFSLINVEEEVTLKNSPHFTRVDDNSIHYHNPVLHLNLYLLFSANIKNYEGALSALSRIVAFFHESTVLTPQNTPDFPQGIDKMIFELKTIGFEQLNQLWGVLGGKYIPSVIYKMRLIAIKSIQEEAASVVEAVGNQENAN